MESSFPPRGPAPGVPTDTAEQIPAGWEAARARKTSRNQYDFLLPVLFLKKVFFGLFPLVLLDWVTGSGPVEEKTGTIFAKR